MSLDLATPTERPAAALAPAAPRPLNKRQKAAIVVRLLMDEGAELSLSDLPESTLAELSRQMTTLRFVDRVTLQSVIAEFMAEIESIGLSFPTRMDEALGLLEAAISTETALKIRKQSGIAALGDPWEKIGAIETEQLLPLMQEEGIEVCAILLSKLKVSRAAEILGALPGERARRIAYAISLTGNIAPETVRRIGLSLASQLDAQPVRAFGEDPVERVGAILNSSPSLTREDVLQGLHEADRGFAEKVRRAIFTFANIPARIEPRDIPKIMREVDAARLVVALAGAAETDGETVEFILGNMSQRMAGQIREDMAALGAVKPRDADAAQTAVVTAIRDLESAGEILLIADED